MMSVQTSWETALVGFFFFSISFSYSFKKQTSTNNSEELFMDPFLFSADVIVLGHL